LGGRVWRRIKGLEEKRLFRNRDMAVRKTKHLLDALKRKVIVAELASHLRETHGELLAAYLFGTFATQEPFSDIDLGVLLQQEVGSPVEYELSLEIELERIAKKPVDVRILNHAPPAFCREVIRNRSVILDRNPAARADFEALMIKKCADFMPYRRRYLEDSIHAPI
jgi:predicted nucleotidyltransferase